VIIRFKDPSIPVHTITLIFIRVIWIIAQFEWTFQRQLFDCLHDY
jgi:hypothetical protein